MSFSLIIGSWLWRLTLCGPRSSQPGRESLRHLRGWEEPGPAQLRWREGNWREGDIEGDVRSGRYWSCQGGGGGSACFFSPGDQHCLSVISAIDKLLQSSSSIWSKSVVAFFFYSTESQEAKSLSSQEHSWLIIKLAGYHGWGWPKYQL